MPPLYIGAQDEFYFIFLKKIEGKLCKMTNVMDFVLRIPYPIQV